MLDNLLYRVTTDKNARYVAQSGVMDDMDVFDVKVTSPKFRKADAMHRWLLSDIRTIDVWAYSIGMELDIRVARKNDHAMLQTLAHSLNATHADRREY